MTIEVLASPQFQSAFTVAIQLIFPNLTIGLASFLAVVEGLWLATRNEQFRQLYVFWVRIFAVAFGLGAATLLLSGAQLGWDWTAAQAGLVTSIQAVLIVAMLSRRRLGSLAHFTASLVTATSVVAGAVWLVSVDSRAGDFASGYDVRLAYTMVSA
jgi:cytochrome d ubiquinol oxidase subunit I